MTDGSDSRNGPQPTAAPARAMGYRPNIIRAARKSPTWAGEYGRFHVSGAARAGEFDHRGRYRRPALTRTDGLCGASAPRRSCSARYSSGWTCAWPCDSGAGPCFAWAEALRRWLARALFPAVVSNACRGGLDGARTRAAAPRGCLFRGEVDIEGGLFAALALKDHLEEIKLPLREPGPRFSWR